MRSSYLALMLLPIAVAAAWSLVACDQNAAGSTKATAPQKPGAAAVQGTTPPAVTVAPVTRKDTTPSADFVGRVTPIDKVDLVARVQSFLEKRLFTVPALGRHCRVRRHDPRLDGRRLSHPRDLCRDRAVDEENGEAATDRPARSSAARRRLAFL